MSNPINNSAIAGWYPDPQNPSNLRWWDGVQWTQHVAPTHTTHNPTLSPNLTYPQSFKPTQVAPQPKNKKLLWWLLGSGVALIIVLVFLISGVLNYLGFTGRLSDSDVASVQNTLQAAAPNNIRVEVSASGSSCEQLCQNIDVQIIVPADVDAYSAEDIKKILVAAPQAYTKVGKNVPNYNAFCFSDTDNNIAMYSSNAANETFADHIRTILKKIDLKSNGDYFLSYGCVRVTADELKNL